jgi:hypothetical protein
MGDGGTYPYFLALALNQMQDVPEPYHPHTPNHYWVEQSQEKGSHLTPYHYENSFSCSFS